jgi:hypothetical protein
MRAMYYRSGPTLADFLCYLAPTQSPIDLFFITFQSDTDKLVGDVASVFNDHIKILAISQWLHCAKLDVNIAF